MPIPETKPDFPAINTVPSADSQTSARISCLFCYPSFFPLPGQTAVLSLPGQTADFHPHAARTVHIPQTVSPPLHTQASKPIIFFSSSEYPFLFEPANLFTHHFFDTSSTCFPICMLSSLHAFQIYLEILPAASQIYQETPPIPASQKYQEISAIIASHSCCSCPDGMDSE